MTEQYEPVRTSFTDAQLAELLSAHQWIAGYMAGINAVLPRSVKQAIWNFTPPHLRFLEDQPND